MSKRTLAAACSLLLMAVGACGVAEGPAAPRPRVAIFQDGTFPDARSVVSPAVLGLDIALGETAEVVILDVEGSSGDAAARTLAADPSVVAVVVAPFTRLSEQAVGTLTDAGMPVLSLSSATPALPSGATWREVVPAASQEARALARSAEALSPGGPVCLGGEMTSWSEELRELLRDVLRGTTVLSVGGAPAAAGADAARLGCRAAIWTGSAAGGAEFRRTLDAAVPLVLASSARTDGYLEGLGPLDEIQLGACPCSDLTTSADADPQDFVHTYQAETGLDPGPFAVEGFDVGRLLAGLLQTDQGRAELAARVSEMSSYAGVAATYRWTPGGDLLGPPVRMYLATGVHWLVEEPSAPS